MGKAAHVVIHVIATNFFGGPEKQILKHCSSMDSQQWRMIVCSFLEGKSHNELLERSSNSGIETSTIHTVNAYNPLVILEMHRMIKKKRPDIVVAHGYRSQILCLILKMVHRTPVIGYSRGLTSENLKIKLFEYLYLILLRFSDLIVAVSDGHRRYLMGRGLNGEHIKVIHNAVEIEQARYSKELGLRKNVFKKLNLPECVLVVTAGRLSPEKGYTFLIEAISQLRNDALNAFFVFCGDGVCRPELEEFAKKSGVADRCRFVGFRKDLSEIYHVMDFMILPSLTEGLPNVILEAFAHKKPVIATAVGGVPEVVEDGKNGILVPPKRPDSLAQAIEQLIASRELRIKMGEAGYNKVRSEFTFSMQNEKLSEIYHSVLS